MSNAPKVWCKKMKGKASMHGGFTGLSESCEPGAVALSEQGREPV